MPNCCEQRNEHRCKYPELCYHNSNLDCGYAPWCRTAQITDPTPGVFRLQPDRHRRVRCICFVRRVSQWNTAVRISPTSCKTLKDCSSFDGGSASNSRFPELDSAAGWHV